MAKNKKRSELIANGPVARNRKARFSYAIEETVEAGMMLMGSEVKSLRMGRANISEAYAAAKQGDLYLMNAYIPEWGAASHFKHETHRPRKLLLHKRQLDKLIGAVRREGMTLVPLEIYFNKRGIAKVQIALASGKQQHDKRETMKNRDWQRQKGRLMREKG